MDQNLVNKLIPQNWPKILGEGEKYIYIFLTKLLLLACDSTLKKQYIKSSAIMPVPHFYA
jgi:hypothetical protein